MTGLKPRQRECRAANTSEFNLPLSMDIADRLALSSTVSYPGIATV
jgi:hypothetical protein